MPTPHQFTRLRDLLAAILPSNRFYARKFAGIDPEAVQDAADLTRLPFTTKAELIADQEIHPPYGSNLTYPLERYCRLHQTSGTTTGRPLRWLDTPESWDWMLHCWTLHYQIAGVGGGDRLFFPFSFGPFVGFWGGFEAAARQGWFVLPGGGISSAGRVRFLLDNRATVVLCTPTYALHLAEVAHGEGLDLAGSAVRMLIVAGEPGGSIPATRARMEAAWGARVIDHSGMTEIGPLGIECLENPAGLHLIESECLPEIVDPQTGQPVAPGQLGELVLTNFGRKASPLIRYRTGDLVRADLTPCPCGRPFLRLVGGILGRTDDMIYLRGNNFYPSALEAILRRFPEVVEYRVEVDTSGALADLQIQVELTEAAPDMPVRLNQAIRSELLFRAEVAAVPPGTLPRFEMKAQRISRKGTTPSRE